MPPAHFRKGRDFFVAVASSGALPLFSDSLISVGIRLTMGRERVGFAVILTRVTGSAHGAGEFLAPPVDDQPRCHKKVMSNLPGRGCRLADLVMTGGSGFVVEAVQDSQATHHFLAPCLVQCTRGLPSLSGAQDEKY